MAYGRTTNKKRGTSFRRRGSSTRRKSMYKRRPIPSRLASSRKGYTKSRALSSYISNVAESKLLACVQQDERQPFPIQTGAQATALSFNTGINPVFTSSVPIDGITVGPGTAFNQRTGNYVYFKKTHGVIRTEMNAEANLPPTQFRMIICKLRRQNSPEGVTSNWSTSGFLNSAGLPFGHETGGTNGLDLMSQPLNKRQWVIYKDTKFILQAYNDFPSTPGVTNIIYLHYPSCKEVSFNLPYYKKTYVNAGTNLPEDLAYRYIIVTYAHTLGRSGILADAHEQSFRGTTSYSDI